MRARAIQATTAMVALFVLGGAGGALALDIEARRAFLRTGADEGTEITSPAPGANVFVHVSYVVVDATGPVVARVRATVDGVVQCAGELDLAGQGVRTVRCNGAWTATAGTHTLRWELDVDDAVAETDENNNVVETTFVSGIDVEARRAYLRTGRGEGAEVPVPDLGQDVYLHVAYLITGSDMPVPVGVRALLDGVEQCAGDLDLESGSLRNVWCNGAWRATSGTHTLRWELDPAGRISETDESNNVAELTFTTEAEIDVIAARAYLRTGPNQGDEVLNPAPGETVFLHVDVVVEGATGLTSVTLRALLDGAERCSGRNSIPAATTTPIWCTAPWEATPGRHTLRWELDVDGEFAERNENNNVAERAFTTGAAACPGDCDGDGVASVAELVRGIGIALGTRSIEACRGLDTNGDGSVVIAELVEAVARSLHGCS